MGGDQRGPAPEIHPALDPQQYLAAGNGYPEERVDPLEGQVIQT
ncbi:MAG: hypothetical protein U0841_11090 [Chloroflexia bacterium]